MSILSAVRTIIAAALMVSCLAPHSLAQASPASLSARPSDLPALDGRTGDFGITVDGARAAVFVPVDYAPTTPAPLLVLLHGATQQGRALVDRFRDDAAETGAIVIAPQSRRKTWDLVRSYGRNGYQGMSFGEDVGRVDGLLSELFSRYAIDPERVAIAGFSDGASYSLSLGLNNTELFSAVAAIAPGLTAPWGAGRPVRVFIAHGENDRVLPVEISRDGLAPQLSTAGFAVETYFFDGGHEVTEATLDQLFRWLGWASRG